MNNFLEIDEMKSVLYSYQLEEISEGDSEIIQDGIDAAIEEVKSYFFASNNRREVLNLTAQQYANYKMYDVEAIFAATGAARNQFILRLCKRIAAYNICELANVDVRYDHVKERYAGAIKTLDRIAGFTDGGQLVISALPSLQPEPPDGNEEATAPFRMGSRPKFTHDF
jgi:predicted DNA-binding protein